MITILRNHLVFVQDNLRNLGYFGIYIKVYYINKGKNSIKMKQNILL